MSFLNECFERSLVGGSFFIGGKELPPLRLWHCKMLYVIESPYVKTYILVDEDPEDPLAQIRKVHNTADKINVLETLCVLRAEDPKEAKELLNQISNPETLEQILTTTNYHIIKDILDSYFSFYLLSPVPEEINNKTTTERIPWPWTRVYWLISSTGITEDEADQYPVNKASILCATMAQCRGIQNYQTELNGAKEAKAEIAESTNANSN